MGAIIICTLFGKYHVVRSAIFNDYSHVCLFIFVNTLMTISKQIISMGSTNSTPMPLKINIIVAANFVQ